MYQYTRRSLSPLAKCKDGCDEGNIEKVARNTLRTKKLTSELTGILVVLTHPAPARFRFTFARNDLGQGDGFFHLLRLSSYTENWTMHSYEKIRNWKKIPVETEKYGSKFSSWAFYQQKVRDPLFFVTCVCNSVDPPFEEEVEKEEEVYAVDLKLSATVYQWV